MIKAYFFSLIDSKDSNCLLRMMNYKTTFNIMSSDIVEYLFIFWLGQTIDG